LSKFSCNKYFHDNLVPRRGHAGYKPGYLSRCLAKLEFPETRKHERDQKVSIPGYTGHIPNRKFVVGNPIFPAEYLLKREDEQLTIPQTRQSRTNGTDSEEKNIQEQYLYPRADPPSRDGPHYPTLPCPPTSKLFFPQRISVLKDNMMLLYSRYNDITIQWEISLTKISHWKFFIIKLPKIGNSLQKTEKHKT
jgi:hypothetical protein